MIAVIRTGGKQYMVSPGDKIKIEKIEASVDNEVDFNEVLLTIDDNGKVELGTPLVEKAMVKVKVLEQGRGDKITILKYRPKKRYQKKMGHRQPYTKIEILKVIA
ncbi:50S ribosomal protein L21 [Patescibacteria group bacterium]